jgi:hypothetical protein
MYLFKKCYWYLLITCTLFNYTALAQTTIKKLPAKKTITAPLIDGNLNDRVWKQAPVATDFVELSPVAGRHEKPEERTEIRILYDNNAIYLAAQMFETSSQKIARELVNRDNYGNSDYIGIVLDTYLDGINGSGFYVTAAGVQFDAKYANSDAEDANWSAVWQSKVKITKDGWTAEIKIPFSALRFPKKDVQIWGMNLVRKRQGEQKKLFWNELDPKKNGFINQEGQLTGIEKLTPPLRLSFYPYVSAYLNNYPYDKAGLQNTTHSVNKGMDIKYGVNESFTLDLTLVPDFGQVQSDNQVLNLTPFEVKYSENRPFFTEGTELFNKGNLFYSRRIGGTPLNYNNIILNNHEAILQNPSASKLLSGAKLTGRTASGLGIGFLNALTQPMYAVLQDSVTEGDRKELTAPATNYNILVVDKNLKHNSSVTLINTNVTRFNKDYNANVGGFVFNLNNPKITYGVSGFGFISNLFYAGKSNMSGYSYEASGGKKSGNFTWNITEDFASANYNPNDIGQLNHPNYLDHNVHLQYASFKPTKYFTQWQIWSNTYYSRRVTPSAEQALNESLGGNVNLRNFWFAYFDLNKQYAGLDFYEPRIENSFYRVPVNYNFEGGVNTNSVKKLSGGFFYSKKLVSNGENGRSSFTQAYYNLRINNAFSFGQNISYNPVHNYIGFISAQSNNTASVFSLYNLKTVENTVTLKYTFNNVMGLNLRARHYWSKRNNLKNYLLQKGGDLAGYMNPNYGAGSDTDFNTFNLDLIYAWEFSPGSQLSIAYKNSVLTSNNLAASGYYYNLFNTFRQPQNNNFSIKMLFYIDYQNLKRSLFRG